MPPAPSLHGHRTSSHFATGVVREDEVAEEQSAPGTASRSHRVSAGGVSGMAGGGAGGGLVLAPFRSLRDARDAAAGGAGMGADVEAGGGLTSSGLASGGGGGLMRHVSSGAIDPSHGSPTDDEHGAAGGRRESEAGGGAAGVVSGLADAFSEALGGLASTLAGTLHLGGPFAAVAGNGGGREEPDGADADGHGGGMGMDMGMGPRAHRDRKHRSEKPKKAPLLSSNWLKVRLVWGVARGREGVAFSISMRGKGFSELADSRGGEVRVVVR